MTAQQKQRSLLTFLFSNVMVGLEGTIIATALPAMMADLKGISLMSWVIALFMLAMAITTPIWTKLAERFGQKEMFMLGTLIFTLASLIEALSPNMTILLLARVVMGIGAGAMQQLPFVIYGLWLEPTERRKQFGKATSAYAIASVLGPIVGGFIVVTLGWRWVFYINLPIGLGMIYSIWRNFHLPFTPNLKRVDYMGASVLSLMVVSLMLALQFMGNVPIVWSTVGSLMLFALVMLVAFVWIERRAVDPIVPLSLFKNTSFMAKNLLMFLQYGFFGFYTNYLPTWGQGVLGNTAVVGGLILIPASILLVVGAQVTTPLLKVISEKMMVVIGMGTMIVGDIVLVLLPQQVSVSLLMIAGAILGLATGLTNGTVQVAIQESVLPQQISAATALNALLRTLGTSLVLSVLALSLNQTFSNAVRHHANLTFNLLNKISDSTAAQLINAHMLPVLRHTMYTGMHELAVLGGIILVVAFLVNLFDPWTKPSD
ncbi:MAG TPA: MFS transporter [Lactobacillaceae bacterium]|jgi:EmrB/QacA subfamily drug resistance transporter